MDPGPKASSSRRNPAGKTTPSRFAAASSARDSIGAAEPIKRSPRSSSSVAATLNDLNRGRDRTTRDRAVRTGVQNTGSPSGVDPGYDANAREYLKAPL